MQRNPRAVETAKVGKADRKVERGTGSQKPQREIKKSGESAKTWRGGNRATGEARNNREQSSEAEPNLITGTSSKETMSQGPGRSEVAKRNERERPRGGLKTINKGTHANHGRNPTRDGEQRGRQKVPEMATDRM